MFKASDFTPLLDRLEQFFAEAHPDYPITRLQSPQDLRDQLDLNLSTEPGSMAYIYHCIDMYLSSAVSTAHPRYFNQLWGGFDPVCLMGELVASAANTSMYTYEVAPVATLIEKELIAKLGNIVGFSEADGQFTTGGSNGNLMAMAMARYRAQPEIKQKGIQTGKQLIALVSEDSHYSFAKAIDLLGIGIENLWKVPTNEQGRLKVDTAENLISQAKQAGYYPFFIAGTAGTTVQGAYDPLDQIADLASQEGLWFHVDGAWGSSVLLSSTHRQLMKGAERADSLVWDAHKMMGMSLICSMLLVRDKGWMRSAFSTSGTSYIFHDAEEESFDLGPHTMHCGRRADSIKLWLTWKALGDKGWERRIDRYFSLAEYAEDLIHRSESLDLVAPRQSVNLCFQYCPQDLSQDRNELTRHIREQLMMRGLAMINYAHIKGKVAFRLVICNNNTTQEDIDDLFVQIISIGQELELR